MQALSRSISRRLAFALAFTGIVAPAELPSASAQDSKVTEFHEWTDLATIYNFSDSFRYDGDYGVRGLLTDDEWTLVYVRPAVRYRARRWLRFRGGVALFYNFLASTEDLPELRPWFGVRFVGPRLGGWTLSNYLRVEYRAFYLKEQDRWDPIWRGRWQIQVQSPDFALGSARRLYTLCSIEPFTNFGELVFGTLLKRIRTSIGLGKRVSRHLRIELNYVFNRIRVSEGGDGFDYDDHVVRLRFYCTMN
jgi:hypothetical protein